MDTFKDDKTKHMVQRVSAAIDYYYDDGEPFEDNELMKKLDYQRDEKFWRFYNEFYPALEYLENDGVVKKKSFDTGKGFDIDVYWKRNWEGVEVIDTAKID
jgi:hypothetical protein